MRVKYRQLIAHVLHVNASITMIRLRCRARSLDASVDKSMAHVGAVGMYGSMSINL